MATMPLWFPLLVLACLFAGPLSDAADHAVACVRRWFR